MSNNIVDKYLFCEKRLKEIEEIRSKSYSQRPYSFLKLNYDIKNIKNFMLEISLQTIFVFMFSLLGLYIITNFFALELNGFLSILTILSVFIAFSFISFLILKIYLKLNIIDKKRRLKTWSEIESSDNIELIVISILLVTLSFTGLGLFSIVYFFIKLLKQTDDNSVYKKHPIEYAKKLYLKRYSQEKKLEAKKSNYKEQILRNKEMLQFLYKNKNEEKYKRFYKEIINILKEEENELNVINKRILDEENRESNLIQIKTY